MSAACDHADSIQRVSDHACQICFGLARHNRECAQCHNVFCEPCLDNWLKVAATPSCPMCRAPDSEQQFVHNAVQQKLTDSEVVTCEYGCGAKLPWREHSDHLAKCPNAREECPFDGCDFVGHKGNIDEHTYSCSWRQHYSLDAILQKAANEKTKDASGQHEYASLLKDIMPAQELSPGLLVHFVQEFDTLSGLSVKYDVPQQDLIKLNGLFSRQIHGHATLLVPRPPNWKADCEYPPLEVVVALRKQRMTQMFTRTTKLSPHDAISYLSLASYDYDDALKAYHADVEWEDQPRRRPTTLQEFVAIQQRKSCHGCSSHMLSKGREHCRSCGKIFCQSCVQNKKQCTERVPKTLLGVTSPMARDELVQVCRGCFQSLRS